MRPSIRRAKIAAVLLTAAGCSGISTRSERAAREDLASAGSAYRPEGKRPELPVLTERSTLADLLRYALLNNPEVEAAFEEWRAAVEEIAVERSYPDPMFTLSAEIGRRIESLVPMLGTDPMQSWPLPVKLRLRGDAAAAEAEARRALFEERLLETAVAVKRAYNEFAALGEEIRWTREAVAILDDAERLARARLAVGKVTQQDVLRAQMERDRLRVDLENLDDSRRPLEARLRRALGMEAGEVLPPFAFRLEMSRLEITQESILALAMARNPRLNAMRSEVDQAIALYGLARKAWIPDFSFGLGADVKGAPVMWMPSFGFTLPIWRDKIAAEIARAGARAGAARARLNAEALDLAVRFAEVAFAWREADRNVRLFGERLIPKAEAALASARAGYEGGIAGFLDLLEAERTLLEFRIGHARAIGARETRFAELSIAIAGRWPEGVERIFETDSMEG